MSCNDPQEIQETILCAKICTVKFNDNPIAKFSYDGFILSDDSEYFDTGDVSLREVRWSVYSDGSLIYDFEFGGYFDVIPELSNSSIYKSLILGDKNVDILTFIESLPNTIVPVGTKFIIYVDIRDTMGIENNNISNKYCFTK